MANSEDPDQLASKKPTDLDLHCLQRQGISGSSRTRVNPKYKCSFNHGRTCKAEITKLEGGTCQTNLLRRLKCIETYYIYLKRNENVVKAM